MKRKSSSFIKCFPNTSSNVISAFLLTFVSSYKKVSITFLIMVDSVLWLHTLSDKHERQCLKCQVLATTLEKHGDHETKGTFWPYMVILP